jgi:diketogulonate reductase-like aldo/keto reductase
MRTVTLPGGEIVPALGLGTWHMGERPGDHGREADALRAGLDHGIALIDTAEMYGEGGAEEVVAAAVAGRRDGVFIVSKVYPHNASRSGTIAACERSLKRLKTDRIDLYLLHWRGSVPLAETVAAFAALQAAGKIRHWGVSNFDVGDIAELLALQAGADCAANQVLYHLGERGIEWQLLADAQSCAMPIMAYSPLGQGSILHNAVLKSVAARHAATPATIAIAWTLRHPGVISIPKTARAERVADIVRAADLVLDAADLAALDRAFPAPAAATPLALL